MRFILDVGGMLVQVGSACLIIRSSVHMKLML